MVNKRITELPISLTSDQNWPCSLSEVGRFSEPDCATENTGIFGYAIIVS
ncbi:MAG: hypothetical protein ABSF15_22715 [Candidatus Sulfotelmatobacter sp.]|jgi:hypothetical protein